MELIETFYINNIIIVAEPKVGSGQYGAEIVMLFTDTSPTTQKNEPLTIKQQSSHFIHKDSQLAILAAQEVERHFPKLVQLPTLQFISTALTKDFADPVKIINRNVHSKKRSEQLTMEKVVNMYNMSMINRATFLRQMMNLPAEEAQHLMDNKIFYDKISDYPYYTGPPTIHHTPESHLPKRSLVKGHNFFSLLFPTAQHRRCKSRPNLKAERIPQAKKRVAKDCNLLLFSSTRTG